MSRVITVFGVTGMQGGSVVRGLLDGGKFKVRGVTRNPQSEKAQALAKKGVEVVQASMDDMDSLKKALTGSYGVFSVTNYGEYLDKQRELQQGKNMIDAAKEMSVEYFIYSGLENIKRIHGKECPHFDGKGEVEEYLFASGLKGTSIRYSFYMENILTIMKPQKVGYNAYLLGIPMEGAALDMVEASGAGPAVAAIFDDPATYAGKCVGLSGDKKTIPEYANILSKHFAPKTFSATDMTSEAYGKLGFPMADDLSVMFEFYAKGNPGRDVALTNELNPQTKNFEQWVIANKDALNAALEA